MNVMSPISCAVRADHRVLAHREDHEADLVIDIETDADNVVWLDNHDTFLMAKNLILSQTIAQWIKRM